MKLSHTVVPSPKLFLHFCNKNVLIYFFSEQFPSEYKALLPWAVGYPVVPILAGKKGGVSP